MTTAASLLGIRVRVGTISVGDVRGVVVHGSARRVIGLEVLGVDRTRRFLPWVSVELTGEDVRARSAFMLLDDWSSYDRNGALVVREQAELARLELPVALRRDVSPGPRPGIESGRSRLSPTPDSTFAEPERDAAVSD